jgi:RNA polymerase sigma factor (sigma-70 family)
VPHTHLTTPLAKLRALCLRRSTESDAELLRRFVRHRESAAFEQLVDRHASLVWGVCRRILPREADCEDAFQATFVALVRKCPSLESQRPLGPWLHTVAVRAARKAQIRASHQRPHSATPNLGTPGDVADAVAGRELFRIVDAEIERLPAVLRAPILLCCLEGRTRDEAAEAIGCSVAAVKSRLERGRDRLRRQLMRRGVELPAAFFVLSLTSGRVRATVRAQAVQSALGVAPPAVAALVPAIVTPSAARLVLSFISVIVACSVAVGSYRAILPGQDPACKDEPRPAFGPMVSLEPDIRNFADPDAAPLPIDAIARVGSLRLRHADEVTGLVYSRDGKWLASVSTGPRDATARLWDAATGKEQLRVKVTIGGEWTGRDTALVPRALGFSADGKQFLVVDTTTFRSFDITSGRPLAVHRIAEDVSPHILMRPLMGAGISPDGKTFVLVWRDKPAEIRDAATGAVRKTTDGHHFGRFIHTPVEFSPDGRRFVIGGGLPTTLVFDTESGEQFPPLENDGRRIEQLRFLPSGDTLVGLVTDAERPAFKRSLGFFEVKSGQLARTVEIDNTTFCLAVSPDGKVIAAGNGQKTFSQLIDVATGKEIGRIPSMPSLTSLAFAPNGRSLAGARSYNAAITVWDVASRKLHPTAAEPVSFDRAVFSADSRALIIPGGTRRTVDWRSGKVLRQFADVQPDGIIVSTHLSPDQTLHAVPDSRGPIRLLDAVTGKEVRTLTGHTRLVNRMTFSRDGRRLATGGYDKSIRVWDITSGRELAQFVPTTANGLGPLSLSDDGRILACSFAQGYSDVYTWDVTACSQLARFVAPTHFFSAVVLSPDGRLIAGGGGAKNPRGAEDESEVTIWMAATGQVLHSLPGHDANSVHYGAHCAFSPDGRWLVTGDAAGRLRLWEVASGREVYHFEGHHSSVTANFSPDGRLLVAASADAPCFVWDVSGTARGTPPAAVDVEQLWHDLADADGKKAFAAVRQLVARPNVAVEMIRKNLRPATDLDPARVEKLLRDLDAESYAVRTAVAAELSNLADRIEKTLLRARDLASEDSKRRLDAILEAVTKPTSERLRQTRALGILEVIATPQAAAILTELSRGNKDDRLTIAASESRERLRRRGVE